MRKPRGKVSGFTLIEILVALSILGVLATIAVNSFASGKKQAHYAAMKSDLRRLVPVQEEFWEAQASTRRGSRYGNIRQLQRSAGYQASSGVVIQIRANATGWAARARHASLGRRDQCVVSMGTRVRPFRPGTKTGVIECQ